MNFFLSDEQSDRAREWLANHDCVDDDPVFGRRYAGAIGGGTTYSFVPTGLGVVVKIQCNLCQSELDLTDWDEW